MSTTGVAERRSHARLTAKGTLVVHARDRAHRGRLVNLSASGLFMETSVGPPADLLSRVVRLEMRLDAGLAEWLDVEGKVVRIRPNGLALAFTAPSDLVIQTIDLLSSQSQANRRVLTVVLIDADAERRSAMNQGFRGTGCVVIEGGTPLEAIVRLGESSFEPDLIAIADSYNEVDATAMREFVRRNHPHAKLITIGDELFAPDGIANWLSSDNPDADLSKRIRDVIVDGRRGTRREGY
ncbi:MAG TPA: PilZ domain-containing protein [Kofleriaceae bacterium]|jgi:hypothetical protein